MSDQIEIALQWLAKAKNDLLCAENNLKSEVIPYDTVCFHYQQAAEKLLKAYLIGKGKQHKFTHDLLLILEDILQVCPDAESLRDELALLMPYAVEIRYPDDWFMPSEHDANEACNAAQKVMEWLKKSIPSLFPGTFECMQPDMWDKIK
jgi:HEPN domain-containing protein